MKLQIVINGVPYEVDVEKSADDRYPASLHPESTAPIQSSVVPTVPRPRSSTESAGGVDESKVCRSPIAGIVMRVTANPGERVEMNGLVVVLEAMKMETNIYAPAAGKLKSLRVSPGDAVQRNQILADFE